MRATPLFTRRQVVVATFLAVFPVPVSPASAQQGQAVMAQSPWARATTPGVGTGGVYVTLTSSVGDKLVGASTPAAAKAEVHQMSMDGAVMRMRMVPGGIDLPPGQTVVLAPSGFHIMLVGLRAPLRQGTTVPVRLLFEKAAPVDIEASVQAVGAAGPGSGSQSAMPGMEMKK